MIEAILLIIMIVFVIVFINLIGSKRNIKRILLVPISILLVCLLLFGVYRLSKSREIQLFGHIKDSINTDEKVIALTFDDGPTGKYTEEILNLLASYDIKATFYLNGRDIEVNRDDTKLLLNAGHELGNHTYSHNRLMFKSYQQIAEEIEKTDNLLAEFGVENTTVRSPYCKKLFLFPLYLAIHDRENITFTIEPQTYYRKADEMVNYTIQETKAGDIILLHVLHDSNEEARKALPEIIEYLKDEGYSFLTISELLALE